MTARRQSSSAAVGISLGELIHQYGPLSPESALLVFRDSLWSLASAHEHGVVHRDYGPHNVFVGRDGSSRLVNFNGLSRASADLTRYRMREELDGAPPSEAGNLFAATAVFFECLTGAAPSREGIVRFRQQELASSARAGRAADPLWSLMAWGMAGRPASRPACAASLLLELDAIAFAAYGPDWQGHGRRDLSGMLAPAGAPGLRRPGAGRWPLRSLQRPARAVQLATAAAILVVTGIAAAQSGAFGRNAAHDGPGTGGHPLTGASSVQSAAGEPTAINGTAPGTKAAFSAVAGGTPTAAVAACAAEASCTQPPASTTAAPGVSLQATSGAPADGTPPASGSAPASGSVPPGTSSSQLGVELVANQPPQKVVPCGSAPPSYEVMATATPDETIGSETYHWVRPDGTATAPEAINLSQGQTSSTSTSFTPASDSFSGAATLVFTSPVQGSWSIQLSLACSTAPSVAPSPTPPQLTMGVPSLGSGYNVTVVENVPFSDTFTAAGGVAPYTWSAVGLPPGLTMNPASGTVSGTVTVTGNYLVRVTVRDNEIPGQVTAMQYIFDPTLPAQ